MKNLLVLLCLIIIVPVFADDIDDMSLKMNYYFDQQDATITKLAEEVNLLKGQIKGGDEIIFNLNGHIESLLTANKAIEQQRDLFGMLIDDQVRGYKLELFKWHTLFYSLCGLIVLYIVARFIKKWGPTQAKLALFWLL